MTKYTNTFSNQEKNKKIYMYLKKKKKRTELILLNVFTGNFN